MQPDNPAAIKLTLERGRAARAAGDYVSALTHFENAYALRPDTADIAVALADTLRHLGALDRAEPIYRRLLSKEPEHLAALKGLGHLLRRRGAPAAALPVFEQALALRPQQTWSSMAMGDTLRELGRLGDAERVYRNLLLDQPGYAPALLGLGYVLRERAQHDEALSLFEQAMTARPEDVRAATAVAETLCQIGRLDCAEVAYREILSAKPSQMQALRGLGRLLRSRGNWAGALPLFESVLALRPSESWAAMAVADTLLDMGEFARAEQTYRNLLVVRPRYVPALMGLGRLMMRGGRPDLAIEWFEHAAGVDSKSSAPHLALASALRDVGEYDRAIAAARVALEWDRQNDKVKRFIGHIQLRAGRLEEALNTYQLLAATQPNELALHVEAARVARLLGHSIKAAQFVQEALRRQPDNVGALLESAEQARTEQRLLDSLALQRRGAELAPSNWRVGVAQSRVLVELGKPTAALSLLASLEQDHPGVIELRAKRVQLLQQVGRLDLALAAAREGIDMDPRHFRLWEHWSGLERLTGHFSAAEKALEHAPARNIQQHAKVFHHRGRLLEEQYCFVEAVDCYRKASTLDARDHAIHHDLTRVLLLMTDTEQATAQLDRLLRLARQVNPGKRPARNRSQTHLGQILNEFLMDREALRELQDIARLAPASRMEPLLGLARRKPDYTPAAIAWMVALRQVGTLAAGVPTSVGQWRPIPHRIAQYWDSQEVPGDLAEIMRSWSEHHPDYEYRLFNDRTARNFLTEHCRPEVLHAYHRAREPAQKADLFRLAWLQVNGGFWADADDRCLAPLESVIPTASLLALYQEDLGSVGNDLIGAVPQHPVIAHALEQAVVAVNRGDKDLIWFSTGPGLLTRALVHVISNSPAIWRSWFGHITVLSRSILQRAVGLHCFAAYKRSDRHWLNGLRKTRKGTATRLTYSLQPAPADAQARIVRPDLEVTYSG